jgi:hypothetical protein
VAWGEFDRRITIRIGWEQWAALVRLAHEEDTTASEIVRSLIEQRAEANGQQARPRNKERPPL